MVVGLGHESKSDLKKLRYKKNISLGGNLYIWSKYIRSPSDIHLDNILWPTDILVLGYNPSANFLYSVFWICNSWTLWHAICILNIPSENICIQNILFHIFWVSIQHDDTIHFSCYISLLQRKWSDDSF